MIEMGKKYLTKEGLKVRILATDVKGPYPVVGIITEKDGTEFSMAWLNASACLVPVPTLHHGYIIISKDAAPAILGNVVWGIQRAADCRRLGTTCPEAWIVVPIDWET